MEYYNMDDEDQNDNRFRILGKSITSYRDRKRMEWEASYEIEDRAGRTQQYLLTGSYNGFFRKVWSYNVHLNYHWNDDNSQYGLAASAGRGTSLWKFNIFYRFGLRFQSNDAIGKSNVGGFGSLSASRRLSERQTVTLRSRLDVGTSAKNFNFSASTRYRLTSRFRLFASYSFRTSEGEYSPLFEGSRTYTTSHQARAGVNGRIRKVYLGSYATYARNDHFDSLDWRLFMRTVLFYKVRIGLGVRVGWTNNSLEYEYAGVDTSSSGGNQTTVSVYNNISFSPWYRSVMRIYSSYLKVMDGSDRTDYKIRPELLWRIRKVLFRVSYIYEVDKTEGSKTASQKIEVSLTRPFWF